MEFGEKLKKELGVEVVFRDERLTTKLVGEVLQRGMTSSRKMRGKRRFFGGERYICRNSWTAKKMLKFFEYLMEYPVFKRYFRRVALYMLVVVKEAEAEAEGAVS